MKVLSIGMDRKLFEEGSAVLERQKEYASKMEELHIIIFSLKSHNLKFKKIDNLYLYPTNSGNRISFLLNAYKLGSKIIKQNNFSSQNSVISAPDPMTIMAYILSKRFNIPFQMEIHTDLYDKNFKNSLVTWKNFWYSGWVQVILDRFLIPRADGLRVVNSKIADSIKNRFPRLKVEPKVLSVFVDIEKVLTHEVQTTTRFSQFDHVVLMASRLTKEKRIDVALEAMRKVVVQLPKTGLVVCGEGRERNRLEYMVKKFGLTKNVIFAGWKDDLISLYKTSDIFLLTSEYEGYGMTLVEAGAAGCPIVTTKVGIAKTELFKDGVNSFVCPVGDVECLSNHIIELISNPEKRESFKINMRDSIKAMSISKEEYTANYIALLEKLLKNV